MNITDDGLTIRVERNRKHESVLLLTSADAHDGGFYNKDGSYRGIPYWASSMSIEHRRDEVHVGFSLYNGSNKVYHWASFKTLPAALEAIIQVAHHLWD